MNTIRSRAAWMQAARLALVRRSSSMTPSLTVLRREAERLFHQIEQAHGQRHFVRPMHLGLHDIDRARGLLRPCP